MKLNEPAYRLVQMDPNEWRFEESAEMDAVTNQFDELLERHSDGSKLTAALRKFINDHPQHFDALHHYAMCKLHEGRPLDAFAFSHAAVAVARSAFPKEFVAGRDRLPGGWAQNRPFLRALHGLMDVQDAVLDRPAAIATARELLALDSEDRTGARFSLPLLLLAEHRNAEALAVFERPEWKDTFHVADYLHTLALLRLGRDADGRAKLKSCLSSYPQVARFILEPATPAPTEGARFGIEMGSPCEGWYYGTRFAWVWCTPDNAKTLLREIAAPIAAAGWPRRFQPKD